MGYSTVFTLVTDHLDPAAIDLIKQHIQQLRKEHGEDWFYGIFGDEGCGELGQGWGKWYDYQYEMSELSKVCPDIRLTLHGEGEESGDIWNEHYLNGNFQYIKARIILDDFDPAKLKPPLSFVEWLKARSTTLVIERDPGLEIKPLISSIGGTLKPEVKALEAKLAEQYLAK